MRIFSIVAHPRPTSFCRAISNHVRLTLGELGHEVQHHDLYAENFDPCLTAEEAYTVGDTHEIALSRTSDTLVREHRRELSMSEGLVVVHPNWWGKPPAILAGWLDRVLVPGVAYRLSEADGLPVGLLSTKRALIINTSDTHEERERTQLGDPLGLIWGNCVLPYCGVEEYQRHVFRPVAGSTREQRSVWLYQAQHTARNMFGSDQ